MSAQVHGSEAEWVPTFTPCPQVIREPMFAENRAVLDRLADGVQDAGPAAVNAEWPKREPGRHWDHPLPAPRPPFALRGPGDIALLARVLDGIRGIGVTPGPQPVQDALDAMPGNGRLRGLLARMAATCAERAEPIFADTCADCPAAPGGWCRHHKAMRDESAQFRQLALALGNADSDREAVLLAATAAADIEPSAPSQWPGRRDRAVFLLTEAEGITCPDTYGCCTNESPCGHHAERQEAADFVAAIRDAAIDAGSAAEAALLITAAITEGGK